MRKLFAVIPALIGPVRTGNARVNRPASNLALLDHRGMTWKTDGPDNAWAAGRFNRAEHIDFAAVVSATATSATTIRVRFGFSEAEVDGGSASYDSGALPFISPIPAVPADLYHSHLEIEPGYYTHWRIDIGGHTDDFEASGLVIGKRLEPAEFHDRDFERGVEDLGELRIGRNGVVSEAPGVVLRTLMFRLGWMNKAEYETGYRPMIEALAGRGVSYWCFDPEPNAYRQGQTYLGYFGFPPFVRAGPIDDIFTMAFRLRSIV